MAVYWLGGGSGAGKSTAARRLAQRYGLQLYSSDETMADHGRRCQTPYLREFARMSMDQRWLKRTPEVMLETFHWFRGEAFHCIVEDLAGRSGVLVDGFRLLPVQPLLGPADRAVYLLPTPEFRLYAFTQRGSLWDIAGKTSDPERALQNLLARDHLFTQRLAVETERLGASTLLVDGRKSEEELADCVASLFGLGSAKC